MKTNLFRFVQIVVIVVFLLGSANLQTVLAQDETPAPTDPVVVVTESPTGDVTEVPAATEVPATEVATEAPTEVPTEAPTEVPPVEVDLSVTVSQIADANLVLVDENNNPLNMASQESADLIATGDPWFYDGGVLYRFVPSVGGVCPMPGDPVGTVCDFSTTPIQRAINYVGLNGLPDDSTIHVEQGDYHESLVFSTNSNFTGLTLLGHAGDPVIPGASPTLAPVLWGPGTPDSVGITILNDGISIVGFVVKSFGTAIVINSAAGNQTINITNNTITDNGFGIVQGVNPHGKPGLNINYNVFTNNSKEDLINGSDNVQWINATNNYWGCATGPIVKVGTSYYTLNQVLITDLTPYIGCAVLHGDESKNYPWPYKINVSALSTYEKPTLLITASTETMAYGGPVPPITVASYTIGGVSVPKPATMTTDPSCSTTVTESSPVGFYDDVNNCLGAVDPNYNIVYAPGDMTVTPIALTITANNQTKTYGDTFTFAGTEFSTIGLRPGDLVTSVVLDSLGSPAAATVGGYDINISGALGSGLDNYTITYVKGTMTVNPKPLTITANNQSKTYGTLFTFAGTEFTTSTLVAGDSVTSASLDSLGAPASALSGSYDINIGSALGVGLSNYSITYVKGMMVVGNKPLIITANNQSKTYGDVFTFSGTEFTTSGLQPGDSVSSVSLDSMGSPAAAAVGGYDINISGAMGTGLDSYEITYVKGTMTVNPKALTITANNQSKTYGDLFTFAGTEFTTLGLLAGDSVTSAALDSLGAPVSAGVGGYDINISGASGTGLGNYTITYVKGTMTVNSKALTITANNQSKTYGDLFTFAGTEFTTLGLLAGDSVTSVALDSLGTPVAAGVGGYDINISGASGTGLGDYIITYVKGTMTVNPAVLTITASSGTMVAGGTVPTITAGYSGFVAGDTATSSLPVCSTTATSASPVGTYPSSCTGASDENYIINYVDGTVTVTAPPLPPPPPPPLVIPVTGTGGQLIPVTGGTLIVSGLGHSCMTYNDGQVICWGLNASGQLGDGTNTDQKVPVYVKDLTGVQNLVAGSEHTCALTIDGDVWCWGENASGQLGNGKVEDSSLPVMVTGLPEKVLTMTAGDEFTCVQLMNQEVWCWGKNDLGQLNDGTTTNQLKPVKTKLDTLFAQISGGQGLLLGSDVLGSVKEWAKVVATTVKQVAGALSISANRWGSTGCVVTSDGSVKCWGSDLSSILVPGSMPAIEVGAGMDHNCDINNDQTVSCWGANGNGELGNGTNEDSSSATLVKNLTNARVLGVGAQHTCVLAGTSNFAWCWGQNTYGQLGNNSTTNSNVPVLVILPALQ